MFGLCLKCPSSQSPFPALLSGRTRLTTCPFCAQAEIDPEGGIAPQESRPRFAKTHYILKLESEKRPRKVSVAPGTDVEAVVKKAAARKGE